FPSGAWLDNRQIDSITRDVSQRQPCRGEGSCSCDLPSLCSEPICHSFWTKSNGGSDSEGWKSACLRNNIVVDSVADGLLLRMILLVCATSEYKSLAD